VSTPQRPADWRGEIAHTQPGILSTLPYNKVAQFGLGVVIIMVAWRAYWSSWFSAFAFANVMEAPTSEDGFASPIGLIPFAIDAVCLVGIAGFALVGLIRGAVGPLLGGLPEWLASTMAAIKGEEAATEAAVAVTGVKTAEGRKLTQAEVNQRMFDRLKKLEAKTAAIPEPEPPAPPKSAEEMVAELQARLDAIESEKPAARTTRAKS
jgi:hypothetical protein